uniref:Peptidase M16 middle/third domain-containing protein n=1 Tax=Haptolina ericina TaxID=156174 RepID=A0A7S3AI92_9EUKA
MQVVPPTEILSHRYLFSEFNLEEISRMLAALCPQRACTVLVSKSVEPTANLKEPWYGTRFSLGPVPPEKLSTWSAAQPTPGSKLRLPNPNPFIPTDFSLACDREGAPVSDGTELPKLVLTSPFCRLWHKTDSTFRRPKTNLYIDLVAPVAYEAPAHVCLTRIFTKLLEDELTEFAYDAQCAMLDYSVYNCSTGLRIMLGGYSHKMPVLLEKVLTKMMSAELAEERFVAIKEMVQREYKNFFKEQPYQHAMYVASQMLEASRWHILKYLEFSLSEGCSHAALVHFAREILLKKVQLKVLCHGNTDAAQVIEWASKAKATLGSAELEALPELRLHKLPAGVTTILRQHPTLLTEKQAAVSNADETNSATEVYLQVGGEKRPESVLLELAAQVINKPAYHQLRTTEQLGYIVFTGSRCDLGVIGLRCLVQSSTHDAAYLDERIELFLASVPALIEAMTDEEFLNHRKAIIDLKLEKPKRLRQESSRYWSEIPLETLDFNRDEDDAKVLETTTKQELADFWDRYFAASGPDRRKLSTQIFAGQHALPPAPTGASFRCIDGLVASAEFKATLDTFPPASSFAAEH